jgi:hypothetical protein
MRLTVIHAPQPSTHFPLASNATVHPLSGTCTKQCDAHRWHQQEPIRIHHETQKLLWSPAHHQSTWTSVLSEIVAKHTSCRGSVFTHWRLSRDTVSTLPVVGAGTVDVNLRQHWLLRSTLEPSGCRWRAPSRFRELAPSPIVTETG